MILEGLVSRIARRSSTQQVALDEFGAVQVSQLLPQYARLAAAGKLFCIDMSGGAGQAPVAAMPTTTAEWLLYNKSTSEMMFLLYAAAALQGGTLGLGGAIVGCAAVGVQTAVTGDFTGTVKTCLDGSNRLPDVWLDNQATLVGGTPAWITLSDTGLASINNNSIYDSVTVRVDGMLAARPGGHGVGISFVGEAGASPLLEMNFIVAMIDADYY